MDFCFRKRGVSSSSTAAIGTFVAQVSPETPGAYRVGDVRHTVSSVAKLESLGWKTTKGLEEIFDDYLAWLEEASDRNDYFTPALEAMQRTGVVRQSAQGRRSAAAI